MLHPSFKNKLPGIIDLLKAHKIKKAYAFGSVVTDHFNENSDVDLLISFDEPIDPLEAGKHWWDLHDQLRDLLNREIDLVTENSLKNPYLISEINKTKLPIYG